MAKVSRQKPERLHKKLLQIRESLGLSQNGLLRLLGLEGEYFQSSVSGYELGTKEPPLPVLLAYARAVGISTDVLIDDDLELPEKLPAKTGRQKSGRKGSRGG
jgi:transcriptional regulator with XRE-family HTH domain